MKLKNFIRNHIIKIIYNMSCFYEEKEIETLKNLFIQKFIETSSKCNISSDQLYRILLIIPIYKLHFTETKKEYKGCNLCKENKKCDYIIIDNYSSLPICKECKITTKNLINWYIFILEDLIPNIQKITYDYLLKYILFKEYRDYEIIFLNNTDVDVHKIIKSDINKCLDLPNLEPPMEPII